MKLSRPLLALVCVFAFLLAGCGANGSAPTKFHLTAPVACPPGQSFMGCASGAAPHPAHALGNLKRAGVTAPTPGCKFPDVSSYQGHPDWAAAAGSICAAVAKAGEYSEDPDFAYNVGQLRALHVPWSGYWFVRACDQGPAFASVLNSVGFKGDRDALRPVLDMEVPSARDCAVPISRVIHADFGIWPIVYTAPGTWPGGSEGDLDAWEAAYGSSLPGLPFSATVLAWQRYSPPYTYLSIPGLGYGDVSIDLRGFSKQLAFPAPPPKPPPKPNPFLIYPLKPVSLYGQKISERATVARWWARGCQNPVKRAVCVTTRTHLIWLAGRLYHLADEGRNLDEFDLGPDWSSKRARELKWPERHYRIERILKGSGR